MNLEDKTLIHYSLLGANHPHPHHHHHHFVCSVARKNWLEEEEEEEKKRKAQPSFHILPLLVVLPPAGLRRPLPWRPTSIPPKGIRYKNEGPPIRRKRTKTQKPAHPSSPNKGTKKKKKT